MNLALLKQEIINMRVLLNIVIVYVIVSISTTINIFLTISLGVTGLIHLPILGVGFKVCN